MKLFVTGASGFIGRAVVDSARAQGHEVIAMVRRGTDTDALGWHEPEVTVVTADVRMPDDYRTVLAGADAVVHLAVVFGDFADQFSVNVIGTEQLLDAMREVGVRRLVAVSSFSVYDYRALDIDGVLDETSPIEARPEDRDDYTRTKTYQERMIRETAERDGFELTVIRPGAVYGVDHLWGAGVALGAGPLGFVVAPNSAMKLTYVRNCADAIVAAADPAAIGHTLNVVDDELPTHLDYAKAMRRHGFDVPRLIPVPYRLAQAFAGFLAVVNRTLFGGRAKFPALFEPPKLAASHLPLRYPNDEARSVLAWVPARSLDDALDEIAADEATFASER